MWRHPTRRSGRLKPFDSAAKMLSYIAKLPKRRGRDIF